MARTKQTAKYYGKETLTWTRFHLPRDQKWLTGTVYPIDVHVSPLAGVKGVCGISLARMVETPEQAAYMIRWRTLEDLKDFQSSPACTEFLESLPETDSSKISVESTSSALRDLALDGASISSPPAPSRFLTLEHAEGTPTADLEGRVTFTTFLIPHKDESMRRTWYKKIKDVFYMFLPSGTESIESNSLWSWQYHTVFFWAITEDWWVQSKFGKPEQTEESAEGRTIICEFRLWTSLPQSTTISPEHEEISATDPQARESWRQAMAKVMPPVTACQQERWDIQKVYPPFKELDPEIDL